MIQIRQVSKWYGPFQVLTDCSTSIAKGEVVVIDENFGVRLTSIVTDTSGSWLSLNFGDLLLLACLIGVEQFEKADDRIAVWEKDYLDMLAIAKRGIRSGLRQDGSPLAPMPTAEGKPEK